MKSWLVPNILGTVKTDYKALSMKVDKVVIFRQSVGEHGAVMHCAYPTKGCT
jgi:hypothetical protein